MSKSKKQNYVVVSDEQITPLYESNNENDCRIFLIALIDTLISNYSIMKEEEYIDYITKDIEDNKEELQKLLDKDNQCNNKEYENKNLNFKQNKILH